MILIKNPVGYVDQTEYELADCMSCIVYEALNTSYELTLTYPIVGSNFDKIQPKAWIKCDSSPYNAAESFMIYYVSKPISGVVTVKAEQKFYVAANAIARGRTNASSGNTASELIAYIDAELAANPAAGAASVFTDISNDITAEWNYTKPMTVKQLMSEAAKMYGGMWYFVQDIAYLKARRGQNRGFAVEYGVNMISGTTENDITARYSHICPYWVGDVVVTEIVSGEEVQHMEKQNVFLDDKYVEIEQDTTFFKPYLYDVSDMFLEKPTQSELLQAADAFVMDPSNKAFLRGKSLSISVNFAALKKTAEYINDNDYSADDDRVEIGDNVTVSTRYGENESMICVATRYDALRGRYTAIGLGYPPEAVQRSRTVTKKEYCSPENKNTAYTTAESRQKAKDIEYAIKHPEEPIPDSIVKVSDNEVYAIYGNVKETWKADGTGTERHNFRKTREEVTP